MKYALIGERLGHSFSKDIHNAMGLEYDLRELPAEEVVGFVHSGEYDGFNVTIPYKETVWKAVDESDEVAAFVGAVNTVLCKDGRTKGFNTDVAGMRYMLKRAGHPVTDKIVLILGSGGTSKTARALCKFDGAKKVYVCSRKGEINYSNVYDEAKDAEIIINCTPVGMYPKAGEKAIDVKRFFSVECVADCIYNPLKTALLSDAEENGADITEGLAMLVAQALRAEEIWTGRKIPEEKTEEILARLTKDKSNIVLVGMPGSGKTTVGKGLAKVLGREFVDSDEVIEKSFGAPAKIITEQGERIFREKESETIAEITSVGGRVIATGGGAILAEENRRNMRQNGIVVYLDRDVAALCADNRPITKAVGAEELFKIRDPLYKKTADYIVDGNGKIEDIIEEIVKIYENLGN